MPRARDYVSFSTSLKERFPWPEGFKHASDEEITTLSRETQWAFQLLSVERLRRETKRRDLTSKETTAREKKYNDFITTVEHDAKTIQRIGAVSGTQIHNLSKAKVFVESLNESMTMNEVWKKAKLTRELCLQTLRWTNVNLTLLLIASVGRTRLNELDIQNAVRVFEYLYNNQESLTGKVGTILSEAINLDLHQSKEDRSCSFFASDAYQVPCQSAH